MKTIQEKYEWWANLSPSQQQRIRTEYWHGFQGEMNEASIHLMYDNVEIRKECIMENIAEKLWGDCTDEEAEVFIENLETLGYPKLAERFRMFLEVSHKADDLDVFQQMGIYHRSTIEMMNDIFKPFKL